jgi:hypothetical protein
MAGINWAQMAQAWQNKQKNPAATLPVPTPQTPAVQTNTSNPAGSFLQFSNPTPNAPATSNKQEDTNPFATAAQHYATSNITNQENLAPAAALSSTNTDNQGNTNPFATAAQHLATSIITNNQGNTNPPPSKPSIGPSKEEIEAGVIKGNADISARENAGQIYPESDEFYTSAFSKFKPNTLDNIDRNIHDFDKTSFADQRTLTQASANIAQRYPNGGGPGGQAWNDAVIAEFNRLRTLETKEQQKETEEEKNKHEEQLNQFQTQYFNDVTNTGDFEPQRQEILGKQDDAIRQLAESMASRGLGNSNIESGQVSDIYNTTGKNIASAQEKFRTDRLASMRDAASVFFGTKWKQMDEAQQNYAAEQMLEHQEEWQDYLNQGEEGKGGIFSLIGRLFS